MISEQIEIKLIAAMKSGNHTLTDIYRMAKSALINAKIAKTEHELTESDEIDIIRKEIKKRAQSAEMYKDANRPELAAKEDLEIKLLSEFVPEEMGDAQIELVVQEVITEINASSAQDLGKVMGLAMQKLKGKADGGKISAIAKRLLV
jgi:uncharacterized protein YqeY